MKEIDLDLSEAEDVDQVEVKVKEKLGIGFAEMRKSLTESMLSTAEEVSLEMANIAPLGDYSKLLENNDAMAVFLKEEASKDEHWHFEAISYDDALISFLFSNDAVDDGDILKGYVFVSMNGKIKHSFVQAE